MAMYGNGQCDVFCPLNDIRSSVYGDFTAESTDYSLHTILHTHTVYLHTQAHSVHDSVTVTQRQIITRHSHTRSQYTEYSSRVSRLGATLNLLYSTHHGGGSVYGFTCVSVDRVRAFCDFVLCKHPRVGLRTTDSRQTHGWILDLGSNGPATSKVESPMPLSALRSPDVT